EKGSVVDRVERCASVSRALVAATQWDEVLRLARSPALRVILSNTTEKGYELDPDDRPGRVPPGSFPAKLLAVLRARFDAGLPALTIVPCELREHQAALLRGLLVDLARGWNLDSQFIRYIENCVWLETLVDRIVTGTPKEHALLAQDEMLTVCE